MKYYSEVMHEFFNTEEELKEAEKANNENTLTEEQMEEFRANQKKEFAADVSKQKKEMANRIDEATEALANAEEAYDLAQEEYKSAILKAMKEAKEPLDKAADAVREAQRNRLHAIQDFYDKFGKYSVVYTGDKAYSEWKRSRSLFDDFFNSFTRFRFF